MTKSLPILFAVLLSAAVAAAPGDELPDFGSPADVALSKSREEQLGRSVMLQLHNEGVVLEDPELSEYIATLGAQLAAHASDGTQRFRFFVVDDPAINAFALPGGYIGVNTGLIQASETESELAGVLAHEITHVTQRHIARSIYDAQQGSIASTAAMIAAVLLGASGAIPGDAMAGAVAATQSMAVQRQINFTRANEHEADRLGMEVLADAGFDPNGMASFFEKLSRRYGGTPQVPLLLRTHPVTTDRVAEARQRARLLPPGTRQESIGYALAKARLQVLTAPTAPAAFSRFEHTRGSRNPADRYGLALASLRMSRADEAERLFRDLATENPAIIAYRTGQAEALLAGGLTDQALKVYADATRLAPRNVPLTVHYAEALIGADKPAEAHELLLDLLNNVPPTPSQLRLIARAANAEGDVGNAYFYMSYYYTSLGNLQLAIEQVRLALESPDVHTVDRARFAARLDQLVGYLPEEQRARVLRGGSVPPPQ